MKRILLSLLATVLCFSLVACGSSAPTEDVDAGTANVVPMTLQKKAPMKWTQSTMRQIRASFLIPATSLLSGI